jgi:dolichol-phosphate mannosyltransferase
MKNVFIKQPDLSVVVLCYKSGDLARSFYLKLKKSLNEVVENHQIILVGNYSSVADMTPEIVRSIAAKDPKVTALTKKKQGMMGWDMISGLKVAKGKYVAVIDGDDQFKPELIIKVFKEIKKQNVDFVKTKRLRRDDGLLRAVISFFFNMGFILLFGSYQHAYDVNSKPKIMKRSLLKQMNLTDTGWFIDAEIMLEVMRLKGTLAEVPVRFYKNKYRDSFVGWKAVIEMITKLIYYKYRQTKLQFHYAFNYGWEWVYWPKAHRAA